MEKTETKTEETKSEPKGMTAPECGILMEYMRTKGKHGFLALGDGDKALPFFYDVRTFGPVLSLTLHCNLKTVSAFVSLKDNEITPKKIRAVWRFMRGAIKVKGDSNA